MKHNLLMAALPLAFAIPAFAQTPGAVTKAPLGPVNPPVVIEHGKIYTVGAQGTIDDGSILIENGKIAAVGKNLPVPEGAKIIDAKGKPVTPGFMASYTQIGIEEVELVNETNDSEADQTTDSAAFDVADAINPNSTLIPVARLAGVTRSLTAPNPGSGVFFGQSAVIDLGLGPNLIDKRKAGMLVTLGPVGIDTDRGTRPDTWAKFREMLDDAREYWTNRAGYHKPGGSRDQRSIRIDLDALGPVIKGEEPLIVHAERASDIREAIAYAQENDLKIVILGAEEGWMVAKELADAHIPVIIDTEHNLPETFSDIGATLKNAARLDAAGVTVAFMPRSGAPSHNANTLAQIAGNAVANGMPWDHALAAITKNPAEIWGISATYGTLDPGRDADVLIWDGDPLEVTSAPTSVFIKGAQIPMVSRQTMLRNRYRHLDKKGLPFAYR